MARKVFSGMELLPDEKPVFLTTLHWIIYCQGLFVTVMGLLLGIMGRPLVARFAPPDIAASLDRPISYLVLAVTIGGCFLLLGAFLRQLAFALLVTDRRVVAKYGILSRATFEMVLSKIEGANIQQTMWGRMYGYGDILIKGVGDSFAPAYCVSEPEQFQNALLAQINQAVNPNSGK